MYVDGFPGKAGPQKPMTMGIRMQAMTKQTMSSPRPIFMKSEKR